MREGYGETFHALIGKTIKSVFLNTDKTTLTFKTDGGNVQYVADGDCCSRSWVEHVSDEKVVVGSPVVSVTEYTDGADLADAHAYDCEARDKPRPSRSERWSDLAENDSRCYCECIRAYGWRIQTATGGLDIEMRNSSNGYYGGSMRLVR